MPKYKFLKLDLCTSSYFQGYHGTVLAVPVEKTTTKEELTDLIKDEINSCDWGKLPDLSGFEINQMCDEFILSDTPFFLSLEDTPVDEDGNTIDDYESCYLYFTVLEKDE